MKTYKKIKDNEYEITETKTEVKEEKTILTIENIDSNINHYDNVLEDLELKKLILKKKRPNR